MQPKYYLCLKIISFNIWSQLEKVDRNKKCGRPLLNQVNATNWQRDSLLIHAGFCEVGLIKARCGWIRLVWCQWHGCCSQSQPISLPTLSVTVRGMTHFCYMTHLSEDCIKLPRHPQNNYSFFQFGHGKSEEKNQPSVSTSVKKNHSLNICFESYSPQTSRFSSWWYLSISCWNEADLKWTTWAEAVKPNLSWMSTRWLMKVALLQQ